MKDFVNSPKGLSIKYVRSQGEIVCPEQTGRRGASLDWDLCPFW